MKSIAFAFLMSIGAVAFSQFSSNDSLILSVIQKVSVPKKVNRHFKISSNQEMPKKIIESTMIVCCDSNGVLFYPEKQIVFYNGIVLMNNKQLFFYGIDSYMLVESICIEENEISIRFFVKNSKEGSVKFLAIVRKRNLEVLKIKKIKPHKI